MNTERALIVHSEFVKECVKVGRTVVEELREAIANNQDISDERLEQLFTPLINFVEQETDTRVSRETDEMRAKLKEEKELEAKEEAINDIRNGLDDNFVININGKRKLYADEPTTKRLKWGISSSKAQAVFPELQTAVVEDTPPIKDPATLASDPLLLVEDLDSEAWWDYAPQVNIKIDPPGNKLITQSQKAVKRYLSEKEGPILDVAHYVALFIVHQNTFSDYPCAEELMKIAELSEKAMKQKIEPKEVYLLLGGRYPYVSASVRDAVRSWLAHQYKLE